MCGLQNGAAVDRGRLRMTLPLIELVEAGHILAHQEAEAVMEELLSGHVETPEIVRLLEALNRRPLEVQELAGFGRVMRRRDVRVFVEGEGWPADMLGWVGTVGVGCMADNISNSYSTLIYSRP